MNSVGANVGRNQLHCECKKKQDTILLSNFAKCSVPDLGGFGECGLTPLASFRKIQGLPISKLVRTADSMIIIIIITLQLAPTKFS